MPCESCGASTRRGARYCRDCDPSRAETAPVGVKVAAALAALGGGLTVLLALGLPTADPLLLLAVPFVGGLGAAQVWVAKGLWFRETWAWGWGLVVFGLNAVVGAASFALGDGGPWSALLAAALVAVIYRHHEEFEV